jgi:hypothetical protein
MSAALQWIDIGIFLNDPSEMDPANIYAPCHITVSAAAGIRP